MTIEPFVINLDGDTIEGQVARPERDALATVLMLHGGPGGDKNGPNDLFVELETSLTDLGFATVRFSFRGSGESTLTSAYATVSAGVEDVETVSQYIRTQKDLPKLALLAESMGVTMGLQADGLNAYPAVVLLWPALNLFDTDLSPFLQPDSVERARKDGALSQSGLVLGKRFLEEALVLDVGRYLTGINCPVYLAHGDADNEVPMTHSLRAAAILGNRAQLSLFAGGNHGLKAPHERERVVREIGQYLMKAFKVASK